MFLAEIADKMPSVAGCASLGIAASFVAAGAMLLGRWALAVPLLLAFSAIPLADLSDASFRDAYMRELGWPYLLSTQLAMTGPPLITCVAIAAGTRRRSRGGTPVSLDPGSDG